MLQLIKKIWKRQSRLQPAGQAQSANLLDEVPRYPPFMKGLPVAETSDVLNTQSELIGRIRNVLGYPRVEFDQRVMPVLHRYADYVHLLPASEAHHHRGAGGLLRHGLEVAFWAAQSSEAHIFPFDGPPRSKASHEARWRFAAFLAGLCHDIGKPISDMDITDKPGHHTWRPFREALVPWARQIKADRYFVRWRDTRVHKRHELLTRNVFELVAGRESLDYLDEFDHRLLPSLLQAIGGVTGLNEPLTKVVMKADQESVKRDLTQNRMNIDEHSYGVPVERYVFDAMRTLVNNGAWTANEAGAKVWVLSEGAFIVWKLAIKDLNKAVQEAGVPGVPRDADTLADVLIERGYAIPNTVTTEDGEVITYRYWQIEPDIPQSNGVSGEAKFQVLRLDDVKTLFTNTVPAAIAGKVIVDDASKAQADSNESSIAVVKRAESTGQSEKNEKAKPTQKTASKSVPQKAAEPAKSEPTKVTKTEPQTAQPETTQAPVGEDAQSDHQENTDHIPADLDAVMAMLRETEPPAPALEAETIPEQTIQKGAEESAENVATLSVDNLEPEIVNKETNKSKDVIVGCNEVARSFQNAQNNESADPGQNEVTNKASLAVAQASSSAKGTVQHESQEETAHSATARLYALLDQLGQEAVQLRQLIEPVLNGVQPLGRVLFRVNGDVVVRYPKGLKALGDPAKVLIEMHSAGLVMADPVMPGKKIQTFDGVKAVVFTKTLSRAIAAAIGEAEAASDPFAIPAKSNSNQRKAKPATSAALPALQPTQSVQVTQKKEPVEEEPTAKCSESTQAVQDVVRDATSEQTKDGVSAVPDCFESPFLDNSVSLAISEEEFFAQGQPDEPAQDNSQRVSNTPDDRTSVQEAQRATGRIELDLSPKKITAEAAISELISMIRAGHGRWISGAVSYDGTEYSASAKSLDLVVSEYPHCLSKAQIRVQFMRKSGRILNGKIYLRGN